MLFREEQLNPVKLSKTISALSTQTMIKNSVSDPDSAGQFNAARFIKEIGRGKDGARSLSSDDACLLYKAMLESRVSDLELGAILLSMRIKGESVAEITGLCPLHMTVLIYSALLHKASMHR